MSAFAASVYGIQDAIALGLVGLIVGWGLWRARRASKRSGCRNCPVARLADHGSAGRALAGPGKSS